MDQSSVGSDPRRNPMTLYHPRGGGGESSETVSESDDMLLYRGFKKMEHTFIAIKPDGVQRGLEFKLVGIKVVVPSKDFVQKHYHDLKERPFFNGSCDFLSSGPVIAMVWEGEGVIRYGRKLIGATDPQKSEPGTIRGDLAVVVGRNIIHGSDGPVTAKDEINLWFKPQKLVSYTNNAEKWIYGDN
ncbi:unnamed protein product [Eruca vesicaria subsp. sativa]|uniref:Nucleoside diphosphate kinase n=1 Tax=Eruca vesicaria subsp. sativa TaxID=29727 RepID=A0ABC8IYZ2_ERUVS|nr:unnamed protein product [Eruca vesicaria subsp. sativa]